MKPDDLFLWPEALPWLLAVPVAWLFIGAWDRRRARRTLALIGPRVRDLTGDDQRERRYRSRRLFVGGLLLGLVALLQPSWGERAERIEQEGIDVVVCLDVSQSMLATDLEPNRLTRAQQNIEALSSRLQGDRVGLVVFAGEALLRVPLTEDMASLASLVASVDTLSVARGGTNLGVALDLSLQALGDSSGDHEAIILVTDGEDLEGEGRRAARACGERGVRVHCVGYGSALGSKIPVQDGDRQVFKKDESGQDVVTTMDGESLKQLAEASGGMYLAATSIDEPLIALYEKRIRPMARKSLLVKERQARQNRFQWPLLLAFGFFLADLWLRGGRRSP